MRPDRLARNEELFREVNEAIDQVARSYHDDRHLFAFFCECADPYCDVTLQLAVPEYEHVRKHPSRFIVAEGHERPEIEHVQERHRRYTVVEKFGEAGESSGRLETSSN